MGPIDPSPLPLELWRKCFCRSESKGKGWQSYSLPALSYFVDPRSTYIESEIGIKFY